MANKTIITDGEGSAGQILQSNGAGAAPSFEDASGGSSPIVQAATTANITIATDLNVGDTIDGYTLVDGDLVLVKDQSTASENGVYVAGASPARSDSYNSDATIRSSKLLCQNGTDNGEREFKNTNATAITVDTTDVTYARLWYMASEGEDYFSLDKPDGTSAGGNTRGSRAVDLTSNRSHNYNVAGGADSIAIGTNCRAHTNAVAISTDSIAAQADSIAIGHDAEAATGDAIAIRGVSSGDGSLAICANSKADTYGAFSIGSDSVSFLPSMFAVNYGDNGKELSSFILTFKGTSTDTSASELYLVSTVRATIPANTVFSGIMDILAVKNDGTKASTWSKAISIMRDGSNNTSLVGSVTDLVAEKNTGSPNYSISITADDTNESLKIEFTNADSGETTYLSATYRGIYQKYV